MKTVIKFEASWCQPCKAMDPIFNELAEEYPSIEFERIDVDQNIDMAQNLGIRGVPTFIVFENGEEEIARKSGMMSKEDLKELLNIAEPTKGGSEVS